MSSESLEQERLAITALARACQNAAAETLTWSGWPDLRCMLSHFEEVPAPATWEEATMAAGIAVHFAGGMAARVQRHVDSFTGQGPSKPLPAFSPILDPNTRAACQPAEALRDWLETVNASLRHRRTDDPVTRVQRRLADPDWPSITFLTREVGYSKRSLERLFLSKLGVSMQVYRERERAAAAILLLGSSPGKVDSVARAAGWKTKKGLYEALARFGLTPSAVRRMSGAEVSDTVSRVRRADPAPRDGSHSGCGTLARCLPSATSER